MKAIQELILNKMVPLGFEEKELMYTVQVKMDENVFKTKKDVILYFEQVIWMYQDQEAIRQLLQSYYSFYFDIHESYHLPPSILYEQKFNRLLIQHYLIYDEISLKLLKSAYVKELNFHHSNKKYLENKYIHHLDDLGKAISCLSHEEQLKLDSMYHIHKVVPIEEKICYAFRLLALQVNLSDIKAMLASPTFPKNYHHYFADFLKTHQVDLQTYLLRCEALEYERREKMRFFLGDPFPSGYSSESLYDCLELFLEIECSPFFSTSSFQNTKKILFLRDLFPQVKSNQLYQAVLSLQNIDENLYRVVKKRFGDHLDEVNPINQNEKAFLTKAMELLRQSLDDLGFKGVYKTFYDQFPGIDRMTVRKVLSWVRINSEKYYQIIIARHGISLLEWNRLTTKENTVYLSAIKRFKLLLNRYLCFAQAKVDFKNHKAFLQIIKDRRKGCSIKTLMIKYHLPLEVLFDILNQNLLLFSEELFLDVLYDFFAYHQEEKIINNFRYWMLVSSLHSSSLNHYKEQLVQRIDENLGNIYNIYRYLPQKK